MASCGKTSMMMVKIFQESILNKYFQNTILFCIFKLLVKVFFIYFQNTF